MTIFISGMRRNVNRRKYRNVKKCPKLKLKRFTSESQLKLKEKLPTGSALENQTMNTQYTPKEVRLLNNNANMPTFNCF